MSIHEYQSMGLLGQYGVAIPKGQVASDPEEAFQAAKAVGTRMQLSILVAFCRKYECSQGSGVGWWSWKGCL